MVPRLTAVTLHRMLTSGRNRPGLFACVDSSGAAAGDFVVKFSASAQMGTPGAARELIASLLAIHMGVLCPRAAIVTVDPDLRAYLATQRRTEWQDVCR